MLWGCDRPYEGSSDSTQHCFAGSCSSVLSQPVATGVPNVVMRLVVFRVSLELGEGGETSYNTIELTAC